MCLGFTEKEKDVNNLSIGLETKTRKEGVRRWKERRKEE